MSKYNARKVTEDGITFDSQAEHRRYCTLKMLQAYGRIEGLRVHVPIELAPVVKGNLGTIRPIRYEADFIYCEYDDVTGAPWHIIEDVKGARTDVFNLKWNLLQRIHRDGSLHKQLGYAYIRLEILDAKNV